MAQVHRPTRLQRLLSWALLSQLASISAFAAFESAAREGCQVFNTSPDLSKCPPGTIYVSQSDHKAQFNTIQKAIDSLKATAATTSATILVGAGTYQERMFVNGFRSITILGQIRTSQSTYLGNTVEITRSRTLQKSDGYDNWNTATLWVNGSSDFKAYNLNVRQTAKEGIALALAIMRSTASFYAVAMYGFQDTLFVGPYGTRVYAKGCYIEGTVDFIYGWGTFVAKDTQIASIGKGTSTTAWRGGDSKMSGACVLPRHQAMVLAYTIEWRFAGFRLTCESTLSCTSYYIACSFAKAQDTFEMIPDNSVAVARPWNDLAKVILINCFLGKLIRPTVFTPWKSTDPRLSNQVLFAEFGSYGPGATGNRYLIDSGSNKVDSQHLSYLLDQKTASEYTTSAVFLHDTAWIDFGFEAKAPGPDQEKPLSKSGSKGPALAIEAQSPRSLLGGGAGIHTGSKDGRSPSSSSKAPGPTGASGTKKNPSTKQGPSSKKKNKSQHHTKVKNPKNSSQHHTKLKNPKKSESNRKPKSHSGASGRSSARHLSGASSASSSNKRSTGQTHRLGGKRLH
ncbi:BQ2448_5084 [Microbotryum intermedium]|uniref:pectinesterase n=1 Tax=Microbotryum intermedium TaxID=269621 RepID=A0A238F662_9BASI|nr:BQ2448_5084 [Microbotryum intermedium]